MSAVYDRHGVQLHHGDALVVLRTMPDASVHAVVTDPPYGLADHKPAAVITALTAWANGDREQVPGGRGFMGRAWDAFVPPPAVWDECLRVLKPGGHMLVFAGTRTVDLMGLSIRLAGFEIRDSISWLHGSGFPKGQDISKAIDKAAGAQREVVGKSARHVSGKPEQRTDGLNGESTFGETVGMGMYVTAPATDAAKQWDGWNTSLKPASEPVIWAQKPLKMVPLWDAALAAHHSLGGLLWLSASPARRAELNSTSARHELLEDACASALAAAVIATSPGLSEKTATFSSPALESMCWSIARSWSAILAALSDPTRTSTTSMASSTTTALKTLNSLLAPLTSPNTMPRCACLLDGLSSPAPSAVLSSSDGWAKWRHTLSASAHESAIEGIALAASNVLASVAAGLSSERQASTAPASVTTQFPGISSDGSDASTAVTSSTLVDVLGATAHFDVQGSRPDRNSTASEPIIVARKPLVGTVAANVLAHGCGGINVNACRVPGQQKPFGNGTARSGGIMGASEPRGEWTGDGQGRWPTNVVLDEFMAAELDEQSGTLHSQNPATRASKSKRVGATGFGTGESIEYADKGGASRFFPTFRYQAKAPTKERPKVFLPSCDCEDAWPTTSRPRATDETATSEPSSSTWRSGSASTDEPSLPDTRSITRTTTSSTTDRTISNSSTPSPTSGSTPDANSATESGGSRALSAVISSPSPQTTGTSPDRDGRSTDDAVRATSSAWSTTSVCGSCGASSRSVSHATVKPLALMRWLVRLVTPPGGTVLDMFAGSGTTGEAAALEGFECVLVEAEPDHIPLIVSRLDGYREPVAVDPVTGLSESVDLLDLLGESA